MTTRAIEERQCDHCETKVRDQGNLDEPFEGWLHLRAWKAPLPLGLTHPKDFCSIQCDIDWLKILRGDSN